MATYSNKEGKEVEASTVNRREVFSIYKPDGAIAAEVVVELRYGVIWLKNLWVDSAFRGYRMASELLRTVGLAYSDKAVYLWVQAFDGQSKTDEELMQMYAQFGYKPTDTPGILCRDYSGLATAEPIAH